MPFLEQSWNHEAQSLGYENEREMLFDLYTVNGFSFKQIAKMIGYCTASVRKRVLAFGICPRKKGGPNNSGNRKLKGVSDKVLFETSPKELAETFEIHIATVFTERRFREREEMKTS